MTTRTAADALEMIKAKFGFVPNLIREMARSPAVAEVYLRGQDAMAQASLLRGNGQPLSAQMLE